MARQLCGYQLAILQYGDALVYTLAYPATRTREAYQSHTYYRQRWKRVKVCLPTGWL